MKFLQISAPQGCRENQAFTQRLTEKLTGARNLSLAYFPYESWLVGDTQLSGPTAYLYYVISALGITAGAHRLWSHRTYKARLPLRLFLIIANTMAFQVRSGCCGCVSAQGWVVRDQGLDS